MADTRQMLLEYETEEVGKLARKDPKVRAELISAFSDASETVRERALLAAVEVGDPSMVLDAVRALDDDEANVRIAAAQLIAWYRQPRNIPHLLRGLKDTNTWVRSHCAAGLSKLVNGPIWARLPSETIDKFIDGFPGMTEEQVREYLRGLRVNSNAIDSYVRWSRQKFDVPIDSTALEAELESEPIILRSTETPAATAEAEVTTPKTTGMSAEVEAILSELPEDLRATLPVEDLRRLTPTTARELVDSLMASFPEAAGREKKKTVRVRKVKKVRVVKKGPSREELIAKIPKEVRDSLPPGAIDSLSEDELEALIATPDRESSGESSATSSEESTSSELITKYGEVKGKLLMKVPPEALKGLTEEQIRDMDLDTLRGLVDAFS
ncbi:MAG: HEAT repeat domain-containing protein [Candidatus Thorarchaeota archaeon]|nr:HEAT repeat domain-containing protein [Candidatus Thorarchaeota archaeon]